MILNPVGETESTEKDVNTLVEVLFRFLKIILWVTCVLFVLAVVGLLRSYYLTKAVEELDANTTTLEIQSSETRTAAVEARDTLLQALREVEENRAANGQVDPRAIEKALIAIDRIETYLCGGVCPQERG